MATSSQADVTEQPDLKRPMHPARIGPATYRPVTAALALALAVKKANEAGRSLVLPDRP